MTIDASPTLTAEELNSLVDLAVLTDAQSEKPRHRT
jgi:hypothetical protein